MTFGRILFDFLLRKETISEELYDQLEQHMGYLNLSHRPR